MQKNSKGAVALKKVRRPLSAKSVKIRPKANVIKLRRVKSPMLSKQHGAFSFVKI